MAEHDERETDAPSRGATVSVKDLQLPFGLTAPNVWGISKAQPAVATIRLHLNQDYVSAASKDALDDNTVHYGELAKRIRASCRTDQSVLQFLDETENTIDAMGTRSDGSHKTTTASVEVGLEKASMFGEKVSLTKTMHKNENGKSPSTRLLFAIHNMKIMTLIGVNDYERSGRQPLTVTMELVTRYDKIDDTKLELLCAMERRIADLIQDTSYETLEALGDFTFTHLQDELHEQGLSCIQLMLRFEKPRAIAFADAAVVEILRLGSDAKPVEVQEAGASASHVADQKEFNIIKPYA